MSVSTSSIFEMRKIIHHIKVRLVLLVIVLFGVIFLLGGAFLIFPRLQRFAIRMAMTYYGIPLYIDYSDAKLVPGNLVFVNLNIIYHNDYQTISALMDTLEVGYSWGKPVIISNLRAVNPVVKISGSRSKVAERGKPGQPSRLPDVLAQNISIVNAELKMPGIKVSNFSFEGSARFSSRDERGILVGLKIDTLGCVLHKKAHITSASGTLNVNNGVLSCDVDIVLDSTMGRLNIDKFNLSDGLFDRISFGAERVSFTEVDSLLGFGFLKGSGRTEFSIENTKRGKYVMNFSIDGELWDIPMKSRRIHIAFTRDDGVVELSSPFAKVLGADAEDIYMRFQTESEPIEYEFAIGYVKNFDLSAFDLPKSSLNGSASVVGSGLGKSKQMQIHASLGRSKMADYVCDSADIALLVTDDFVKFERSETPSRIFAEGNSAILWGSIGSDGQVNISTSGKIANPDYFASQFGLDVPLSGNFSFDAHIATTDERKIGIRFNLAGNNDTIGAMSFGSLIASGQFTDVENFVGDFTILIRDGNFGVTQIETLYLSITTAKNKVFFRPLRAKLDIGTVRASGILSMGDSTRLKIDGLTFDSRGVNITLTRPVDALLKNGFSANSIFLSAFGGGIIIDTLFWGDSMAILRGQMNEISLAKFSSIIEGISLSGRVQSHFAIMLNTETMFGNGGFNLVVSPFAVANLSWSSMSAEGKYVGDTLKITMLHLRRNGESANISGNILFERTGMPFADLKLIAQGSDINTFTNFIGAVEPIAGEYSFNLNAKGKLDSLDFEGDFSVTNAAVHIAPLDDPIDSISMNAKIVGNELTLELCHGRVSTVPPGGTSLFARMWTLLTGKKNVSGNINASGVIDFTKPMVPDFDLEISLMKLPLKSTSNGFYFVSSGKLRLHGNPPKLKGDLNVSGGNILRLGSASPEPARMPIPIDISVSTDNIWLLTKEIEARIDGDLFITTADKNISLLGELNIENGKYFMYGQNFDVESGILTFKQISNIDPDIDIIARTAIGNEEIYLHITGKLSQPKLEITSTNPDFTPEELLQLLAGTTDTVGVREVFVERTQDLLRKYAERQIEQIARTTIGVDEIELEPATDNGTILNPSEMRLTVGKQLAGKLFVRYSQVLSSEPQHQIEIQYRLSKHLTLGAMEDKDKNYRLTLDLKWRY